jgi:hypothetical protein
MYSCCVENKFQAAELACDAVPKVPLPVLRNRD